MRKLSESLKPLALERQPGESDKAVQACNDWLRLGPGRTIPLLLEKFKNIQDYSVPTLSRGTLEQWANKFKWAERAAAYDAPQEEIKNAARDEVFKTGLSLDYERVRSLKRLAADLEAQIYETDEEGNRLRLWVRDVKQIGSGEAAQVVELERFNSSLLSEFRGTLDDIAKETGGRKVTTRQEIEDVTDDERYAKRASRARELLDAARERRARGDS